MGLENNILYCISNLIRDETGEEPAGFFDLENLIRDETGEEPAGFFDLTVENNPVLLGTMAPRPVPARRAGMKSDIFILILNNVPVTTSALRKCRNHVHDHGFMCQRG
jgi:hypothetical protein